MAMLIAVGCGDDTSTADGGGSSSTSSTGADATTGTTGGAATSEAQTTTSGGSTSSGGGDVSSSSSSSGAADESGSSTGGASTSTGEASSSSSSGEGSTSTGGGGALSCEDGGEQVVSWTLQVPGGVFPDDIPTDLDETCSLLLPTGPSEIRVDCPSTDLVFTVETDPVLALPSNAQSVAVQLRRAVGPLGFPDFWATLEFQADGLELGLVNSSVLDPGPGFDLPLGMALSAEDCGPFTLTGPFGMEDPCGDQMWLGIDLDLDAPLTVFHGAHDAAPDDGATVDAWVGTARDYGDLPQFCDIAASFFAIVVARQEP